MPPVDPCDHSQVLISIPGPPNNKDICQFMLDSTKKNSVLSITFSQQIINS